jgi:protein-tyrosine phosphatase
MGKDRTGVVAGLLLSLLGVPDQVIGEDYALTTHATEALVAALVAENPRAAEAIRQIPPAMWESPAEAMVRFLEGIRTEYGSVESYAAKAGVDRESVNRLRDLLLEPKPAA